jgi:hypothetical protein
MITNVLMTWRLIGIYILGCVLMSYPVMTIFNVEIMLFGIPLLYLYIFVSWLAIVLLLFLVSWKHKRRDPIRSDSFFISKPDK